MIKICSVFFLWMIFLCWPCFVKGQNDPLCHYSTEGTDFWFGFMENRQRGNVHYLEITIASRVGADITVTYGPDEELLWTDHVNANSYINLPIPYDILEPSGSEITEDKGIHLVASDLVNVYALNYRTQSSDVAVIYPTKALGTEYFAMCYTPNPTATVESNSEFMVVATKDSTTIQITPLVDTDQGQSAGHSFEIFLNKGQLYQVQSMNKVVTGQGDLTGSTVISDKPVAFYSGVKSTSVPLADLTRDHLYEQIPPVSTWGREFFVVPLRLRSKDTYRILAAEDGTTVRIEGTNSTFNLDRGQYKEFDLESDEGGRIIASKRVLLAQYCRSQRAEGFNGVGDPFMVIVSPAIQKINDITFVAYESDLITDIFFVNIVTFSAEVENITLDGRAISSYFKAWPGSQYSYAQVPLTHGQHRLKNDRPNGGFLAYVYGFGDRNDTESYGYGVGFNLDIQLDIGGFMATDTLVLCEGSSQRLDAGTYFVDYQWNNGAKGSSIVVTDENWYRVTATTALGCVKTDSVYVKVENPVIALGPDTGACAAGVIVLDAGAGFKRYLWQDGSTGRTCVVNETGKYSVVATTSGDCIASDTINAVIFEAAFSQNYAIATDQHPDITFTNETSHAISYLWDFGDGETSTDINPVHRYSSLGEYTVTLLATSEFGCSDSRSSTVKIIPFKLLTPNAFRPDSEIAENRIFLPVSEGIDPERYQLRIYSRIGAAVYESTDPSAGWDGRMSNGSTASSGIYVWILNYFDLQGFEHQDKGTVMLVR